MKFCQKCGKEIFDDAVVCPGCGCSVVTEPKQTVHGNDGLATASKVLLILGCIMQGVFLIPLSWCIPITMSVCGKLKRGEKISTGLKVCSLLFVSFLGGIFLLCRSD